MLGDLGASLGWVVVGISQRKQKDPPSAWNYHCSFHLEVFRVSYFPQGTEVLLLASLSKDNTRVKLARVEIDSYGYVVLWKDKLYFYLFTWGTW